MATQQIYVLDGPTEFFFPYPVRIPQHLTVEIIPGGVVPPQSYEVIGYGPDATGVTVRYPNAPDTGGLQLKISRYTEALRVTDFEEDLAVTAEALDTEFDNLIHIFQDNYFTTTGPQGPQGEEGPQGEPGLSDIVRLERTASGSIGGQRMVIGNADGSVSYASSANLLHLGKVLGITESAASDGDPLTVIREGLVEFNGWAFDPDTPVYLSTNGLLTQTPVVTGFSQIVGFAESPTKLFVNLREPILL